MAYEDIGYFYKTRIPGFTDVADIQKALVAYHYGTENEFDRNTTDPDDIVPNSIAGHLKSLQTQINGLTGADPNIPISTIVAVGDILGGVDGDTAGRIARPALTSEHNGKVLTIDTSFTSPPTGQIPGITWKTPAVTLDNSVTLSSKTLDKPKIVNGAATGYLLDYDGNRILDFTTGGSAAYVNIANSATAPIISAAGTGTNIDLALSGKGTGKVIIAGSEIATIAGAQTLTNKTIASFLSAPGVTITVPTSASDTLVGLNLTQTLANKTLVSATTFLSGDAGKTAQFAINSSQALTGIFTLPATNGTLALNNQTFFLGTTSIAINRSSLSGLALTGIASIDGNAATATSATTATTATNIAGGTARQIPVQTAAGTTSFITAAPTSGTNYLGYNASTSSWVWGSSGLTSVGISVPTGLSVSGSPLTSNGTITIGLQSGYSIPTTTSQSNWNTAYGWGNHASAGYASATNMRPKTSSGLAEFSPVSTSYVDGLSVAITAPASGCFIIHHHAFFNVTDTSGGAASIRVVNTSTGTEITGFTSADERAYISAQQGAAASDGNNGMGGSVMITGLTSGTSYTVYQQYKCTDATGSTIKFRELIVVPTL